MYKHVKIVITTGPDSLTVGRPRGSIVLVFWNFTFRIAKAAPSCWLQFLLWSWVEWGTFCRTLRGTQDWNRITFFPLDNIAKLVSYASVTRGFHIQLEGTHLYENNEDKTRVINDPLGQTNSNSLVSSDHCFSCFILLDLKSWDGRTDNMCESNDHYRPWL